MGYILPITHYDYKQYQNRMKEIKESPHQIDSVYKTMFHRISEEYDEENIPFEGLNVELQEDEDKVKSKTIYRRSLLLTKGQKAYLTGKGGSVNQTI